MGGGGLQRKEDNRDLGDQAVRGLFVEFFLGSIDCLTVGSYAKCLVTTFVSKHVEVIHLVILYLSAFCRMW